MHELFHGATGELLSLDEYWQDFNTRFWATTPPGFWKLERQQTFREPSEPSWVAFARGQWDEAMRLIEDKRDGFRAYYQKIAEVGFVNRRVRVVEQPLTPYLHWELHVLGLRHEYGGLTSVVGPEQVAALEADDPLPEIYTLGTAVMYEAVYGSDGTLAAARRFQDPQLIAECQAFIEALYHTGEPLDVYLAREVAHLDPPPGA